MFSLTYVELEYETSISCGDISKDDRTLMVDLLLFLLATQLNPQNTHENEIHNEI
jgi:hypothetical protein